jgi:abortive infection bacteriophage resistance protein
VEKDMDTNNYKGKQPTTFEEQVEILKSRNLIIEDKQEAINVLSRVNYYRLSAYMLTLKCGDRFRDGTRFSDIYNLYEFDKRLRNMCLNVLESIEIAFRTHISYYLSHKYGPTCYCNPEIFACEHSYADMFQELNVALTKSRELFIEHHKRKYDSEFPIWVVTEVASFSLISRLYSILQAQDRKDISETYYQVPYTYLQSWIRSITVFRNICAHYGRIYNRSLTITPKLLKEDMRRGITNSNVFGLIYIMGKINYDKSEWRLFINNLRGIIDKYNNVDLNKIGFPVNWDEFLSEI